MPETTYYMLNRIIMLERQKQYNEKNKQKITAYNQKYWLEHKQVIYAKRQNINIHYDDNINVSKNNFNMVYF